MCSAAPRVGPRMPGGEPSKREKFCQSELTKLLTICTGFPQNVSWTLGEAP